MAFGAIEIFAFFIVVLVLIKLLVIMKNPMTWLNKVAKPIYTSPNTTWVGLVLAAVSLYYLLQTISIVQIFAVFFFFCALMIVGIAPWGKDMMAFATKIFKQKGILKKAWLSTLIWLVLIFWVLYELLL
tara:strand:- start:471 stop:857 length:387 start_codon:yes stop_codon:yes gene_type:complete